MQVVAQAFVIFFSSIETGVRAIVAGFQAIRVAGEKLRRFLGLEEDPVALANAERALAAANEDLFQSSLRTERKLKDLVAVFDKTKQGAEGAAGGIGDLAAAEDDLSDRPPPPAIPDIPEVAPTTTEDDEDAVKKQEAAAARIAKLTDQLRIARERDVEPLNAQLEKLRQQSEELRKQKKLAGEKGDIDEGIALISKRVEGIEEKKARLAQEQVDLFIEIADLVDQLRELSPEFADQIERAAEAAVEAGGGLEKVNGELRQLPGRATAELQREQQRQGKIGEEIGKVLASGISKALNAVLKGEAVNFGEILADTASSLLELALNKVMEKVADKLGDLLDKALEGAGGGEGGIGGLGLAAGLGIGLGLLAGALQDTTASVGAEMAQSSAVQDVSATRGIVAGPTNIPIFQVGSDLKEALADVEELLERIAVAVEGDASSAATASVDQQAGEELSISSPTLI